MKKIGDRWWIIDPHGYPYYMRGVASFRKGSSDRNKKAWNERFGSDDSWVSVSRNELARIGVHQTGAFGSNGGYGVQQNYNAANANAPFPLAPSFGFLSQFRTQKNTPMRTVNRRTRSAWYSMTTGALSAKNTCVPTL